MPSILEGLDDVCDQWLGIDATWQGQAPRYTHLASFQRLCENEWSGLSAQRLMEDLFGLLEKNWSGQPCRGQENWRFKKQLNLAQENQSPEVSLERTIAQITDDNWVNQIPIAAGIDDTGRHHNVDLIHRAGTRFTFIELKVVSNHALFAAFEIVKYGMVYVFTRIHAEKMGYRAANMELLRATEVRLQVLAPPIYFGGFSIAWLQSLEKCLNSGLGVFSQQRLQIPMSFEFSVFPRTFAWNPAAREDLAVRQSLLWALHKRTTLNGH